MNNEDYKKTDSERFREELMGDAPTLASMHKTNPFGTPENYFSSLEHRVMQQIKQPAVPVAPPTFKDHLQSFWESNIAFFFQGRIVVPVLTTLLVLGVSFGGFRNAMINSANYAMGNSSAASTEAGIELSAVSDAELDAYVIANSDEFDLADMDPATLSAVAENYKMTSVDPGSDIGTDNADEPSIEEML